MVAADGTSEAGMIVDFDFVGELANELCGEDEDEAEFGSEFEGDAFGVEAFFSFVLSSSLSFFLEPSEPFLESYSALVFGHERGRRSWGHSPFA